MKLRLNPLVVMSLVILGILAQETLDYIDLPEKQVCLDTADRASNGERYVPYYVNCSKVHKE